VKDVICEETARLGVRLYHDRLRAVVLTGSLARNEGTFVKDEQGLRLLGDAEVMLVFDERVALPSANALAVIREKIKERIRRRGVHAAVTLAAVGPNYLRRLPPSIFAYELRACGETVAGDPTVLGLIPSFTAADIPSEDAWRMLANRLAEQLESVDELLGGRSTLSPEAHYRTVKLYLDMATSFLVFVGDYAPTYAERARNLVRLAESAGGTTSWPFPLGPFADDVASWTAWKVSASSLVVDAERVFWERAMNHAKALWGWELARLQGLDREGTPSALMSRWMRRQPLDTRLRGWAHVARARGWHRSWRLWPRWLRQVWEGSPRHLVYRAASTLMFELSDGVEDPHLSRDLGHLRRDLPVGWWLGESEDDSLGTLAGATLANYRTFLRETRA